MGPLVDGSDQVWLSALQRREGLHGQCVERQGRGRQRGLLAPVHSRASSAALVFSGHTHWLRRCTALSAPRVTGRPKQEEVGNAFKSSPPVET